MHNDCLKNVKVKVKVFPQQAEVAQGVPGRLRHYEGGRSSAICTGRLYPRRNPWYSFSVDPRAHGSVGKTTEKNPQ